MKKRIFVPLMVVAFIAALLIIYPHIEIDTGKSLVRFSYSDRLDDYEDNASFGEVYFYNEEHDVSLYTFDIRKFWFFYVIVMDYVEGDARETQFVLGEEYIKNFIKNAEIEHNSENIDLEALIEGKTAIPDNKRYLGNDYNTAIYYVLNGRHEVMYIFESEGLLVIQVGNTDEGPKYIAYK